MNYTQTELELVYEIEQKREFKEGEIISNLPNSRLLKSISSFREIKQLFINHNDLKQKVTYLVNFIDR